MVKERSFQLIGDLVLVRVLYELSGGAGVQSHDIEHEGVS